jgi:lipase maturation factor 1
LCLFLMDDSLLSRMLPASWMRAATRDQTRWIPLRTRRTVAWAVTILIAVLSGSLFVQTLTGHSPAVTRSLVSFAAPFGVTSSYGLFATMTTKRPEIVIEGSNDGTNWLEYEFKYKPGRLDRPPPWVAPHQPRLDWQMWFAALGTYQENVWFVNLLARLLQGRHEVLALIQTNPFHDRPPRFIRARLYEYRFTDRANRRETGNWWIRTPVGLYVPPVTLEDLSTLPLLR